VVAVAANLPFADENFDLAISYNVLMDIENVPATQPLENYVAARENAGFAISALREPIPDANVPWTHTQRWSRILLFLWLKARPLPVDRF
jgi:hypothetical protein